MWHRYYYWFQIRILTFAFHVSIKTFYINTLLCRPLSTVLEEFMDLICSVVFLQTAENKSVVSLWELCILFGLVFFYGLDSFQDLSVNICTVSGSWDCKKFLDLGVPKLARTRYKKIRCYLGAWMIYFLWYRDSPWIF